MPHTTTSKALYQTLYKQLRPAIDHERECHAIVSRLLAHYGGIEAVQIALDTPIALTPAQQQQLDTAVQRLVRQEPLQYVLGVTPFFGRTFSVSPAVLIPRPETESLVQHIVADNPKAGRRVLDIGTGSGCIAITLQQELPQATVDALDISAAALQVATTNAAQLGATVHYFQADILQTPLPDKLWDVIVSNPPYVRESEKDYMHRRVLDHEPAEALFVPDHAPLLFYERIAQLARTHLAPGGKLYVEINEAFGAATAALLAQQGLHKVSISQDIHGKDRWVVGSSACPPTG